MQLVNVFKNIICVARSNKQLYIVPRHIIASRYIFTIHYIDLFFKQFTKEVKKTMGSLFYCRFVIGFLSTLFSLVESKINLLSVYTSTPYWNSY